LPPVPAPPPLPFVLFQAGNFPLTPVVAEFQGKRFLLDAEHISEGLDLDAVVDFARRALSVVMISMN
jgi:hypothetical protein